MRPYFIVNPVACGGEVIAKFKELCGCLKSRGVEYESVETTKAGEGTAVTEAAYERGERYIVSVGGDGTLSEIAAALCNKKDAVLGVCPFGTGNDFARALKLPEEIEKIAEILISGKPKPIDMGLAGDRPFINIGGLGFDVDVVINTEKYKSRYHGMIPYLFGIIDSMAHLNRVPVKLTCDGVTTEETVLLIAVANGTHFGGGMPVAPKADPSDGKFDVCIIKNMGIAKFLSLLPSFMKGKHLKSKKVRYFTAEEVIIECERTPLQLDGELGEYAPVRFKILKSALNVML